MMTNSSQMKWHFPFGDLYYTCRIVQFKLNWFKELDLFLPSLMGNMNQALWMCDYKDICMLWEANAPNFIWTYFSTYHLIVKLRCGGNDYPLFYKTPWWLLFVIDQAKFIKWFYLCEQYTVLSVLFVFLIIYVSLIYKVLKWIFILTHVFNTYCSFDWLTINTIVS
jgi:hypothetical protein